MNQYVYLAKYKYTPAWNQVKVTLFEKLGGGRGRNSEEGSEFVVHISQTAAFFTIYDS
jgi:hypothetical protein